MECKRPSERCKKLNIVICIPFSGLSSLIQSGSYRIYSLCPSELEIGREIERLSEELNKNPDEEIEAELNKVMNNIPIMGL